VAGDVSVIPPSPRPAAVDVAIDPSDAVEIDATVGLPSMSALQTSTTQSISTDLSLSTGTFLMIVDDVGNDDHISDAETIIYKSEEQEIARPRKRKRVLNPQGRGGGRSD
jgi:hypothetical protein